MSGRRRALGRGLDALIPAAASEPRDEMPIERPAGVRDVDIDLVSPNPEQPRIHFDPERLQELSESIRAHGVIQPLVVSAAPGGTYRLIAGERRLQAARLAGLERVPVVVRESDDGGELLELALVENIQRADLNPIEEAMAYRRLMDEYGHTQEEVARRVGKSRTAVANAVRLLALEPEIRQSVAAGEISEGHARALLAIPEGPARVQAWREVVRRRLTVRQVEQLARQRPATATAPATGQQERADPVLRDIEIQLQRVLGTRVTVRPTGDGATITINCHNTESLDAVIEQILGEAQ